jgi:hypothetical protein
MLAATAFIFWCPCTAIGQWICHKNFGINDDDARYWGNLLDSRLTEK